MSRREPENQACEETPPSTLESSIMGVVNVTPDSFSDGGLHFAPEDGHRRAVAHGCKLVEDGADWLDVGGESTRPGAPPVSVDAELARVLPVIRGLRDAGVVRISIDTRRSDVMRAALDAGATMLNDVSGFRDPRAREIAADAGVRSCIMHMQGEPGTMQREPRYADVVGEVERFLLTQADALMRAGLPGEAIVLDPGFGFGKTLAHNRALFRALPRLAAHGFPLLVGVSRKSMLAALLQAPRAPDERVAASTSAALLAVVGGASIVRVHDVAETRDALTILAALAPGLDFPVD